MASNTKTGPQDVERGGMDWNGKVISQYYSGDKIEKNEMGWACSAYRRKRGVYRVLVEKPERKRPLGGTRRRWDDNIKMGLQEVECGVMDWIGKVVSQYCSGDKIEKNEMGGACSTYG
jgi:hypothetical protein